MKSKIFFKKRINDISEEFSIKKTEFCRDSSLYKQQIEHLNNKIEDLKEALESNQLRYEERLCKLIFYSKLV